MKDNKPNNYAIAIDGLFKTYEKEIKAVSGVNLQIPKGKIYALLGPNGAGKTTIISILTTLTKPTKGSAKVANFDVAKRADEVRKRIGVTFQETVLDEAMTGLQVLDFHGQLYNMPKGKRKEKIKELLKQVELEDSAKRKVKTYSGGMKRRLELARGLMTEPEILFLDEPTLGLDPQNRMKLWEYIKGLNEQKGMTILITTHYMEEAEKLADIVGIIDHGKLIIEGTPLELINKMGSDVIIVEGSGNIELFIEKIQKRPHIATVTKGKGLVHISVDSAEKRVAEISLIGLESKFEIKSISMTKPDLGDVFIKYTGRQLRDESGGLK